MQHPAFRAATGALLLACLAGAAPAQQVYRIVGPDGRVTFSDKPPVQAPGRTETVAVPAAPGSGAAPGLPYELRTVADRYPVTLYTASDCAPCSSARSLLRSRGVPFSEKTVVTGEDAEALKRLSGDTSLPFATVGGQHLRGFADAEWTQYLDAAGYPKQSQLPASYQPPAATPLAPVQRVVPAAGTSAGPAGSAPATRPAPAPAPRSPNPAGIQF